LATNLVGFLIVSPFLTAEVLFDVLIDVLVVKVRSLTISELRSECEVQIKKVEEDEVVFALVVVKPIDGTVNQ
jgi:hypothetical protein